MGANLKVDSVRNLIKLIWFSVPCFPCLPAAHVSHGLSLEEVSSRLTSYRNERITRLSYNNNCGAVWLQRSTWLSTVWSTGLLLSLVSAGSGGWKSVWLIMWQSSTVWSPGEFCFCRAGYQDAVAPAATLLLTVFIFIF